MSYSNPSSDNHAARVEAIQRELFALKILTSVHAVTVAEQVNRIQERLAALSTPIGSQPTDTMDHDV